MTALNSLQLPNVPALDATESGSPAPLKVSKSGENLTYVSAGESGKNARLDKGLAAAITPPTPMTTLAPPLKTL
nr:hypothetical protein [Kofleriaceae bacterium]